MKLEYLDGNSADLPLIRLFDFDSTEIAECIKICIALSEGRLDHVAFHNQPFMDAIDGCQLIFRIARNDKGIVKTGDLQFDCVLTRGTWDNIAGLMEPFLQEIGGHQWLNRVGDARLLLSADGCW